MSSTTTPRQTRARSVAVKGTTPQVPAVSTNVKSSPDPPAKSKNRHTKFTDNIYVKIDGEKESDYMKSFIKKASNTSGICAYRPPWRPKTSDPKEPATENLWDHILIDVHELKAPKEERDKYH